eukprot:sb/3466824/
MQRSVRAVFALRPLILPRGARGLSAAAESDQTGEGEIQLDRRFEKVGIPFESKISSVLTSALPDDKVILAKDGKLSVPQDHYKSLLNEAFGHGGWALIPVDDIKELPPTDPDQKYVQLVREYALYCHERFISQAFGETNFYSRTQNYSDAAERIKETALTRCCKDFGVASELWDKRWADTWRGKYGIQEWAENVTTQRKANLWRRKDEDWSWPFKSCFSLRQFGEIWDWLRMAFRVGGENQTGPGTCLAAPTRSDSTVGLCGCAIPHLKLRQCAQIGSVASKRGEWSGATRQIGTVGLRYSIDNSHLSTLLRIETGSVHDL